MAREACPTCGQPRLGAFRYCRSCGLDFDVHPGIPIADDPPTADPPPTAPTPADAADATEADAAAEAPADAAAALATAAVSPTPVRPSRLVASGDPTLRSGGRRRLALPGGISPSYAAVAVIGLLGAATLIGLVRGPAREATAGGNGTPAANAAPAPVLPLSGSAVPTAPGIQPDGPTELATEVNVVDGDTIDAVVGGLQVTVRYIGVDAPDRAGEAGAADPLAEVAADINEALLAGGTVLLEPDATEADDSGRLLRHVWIQRADGGYVLVGLELVREGLAAVQTVAPNVKYETELNDAQTAAQAAQIGIWGS